MSKKRKKRRREYVVRKTLAVSCEVLRVQRVEVRSLTESMVMEFLYILLTRPRQAVTGCAPPQAAAWKQDGGGERLAGGDVGV